MSTPAGAIDLEEWMAQQAPYDGLELPPPPNMIYTSARPAIQGRASQRAPTPEQLAYQSHAYDDLRHQAAGALPLLPGPLYHSAPECL